MGDEGDPASGSGPLSAVHEDDTREVDVYSAEPDHRRMSWNNPSRCRYCDGMTSVQRSAFAIVTTWVSVACLAMAVQVSQSSDGIPTVGQKAVDFTLRTVDGQSVRLSEETKRGPVVLVVLRGWPGYQCPFCTRQFGDYLSHAAQFEERRAHVLFVYPGPSTGLEEHARAFTTNRELPAVFRLLVDPDYTFTTSYGLRWDAPGETAYPTTFVIGSDGLVAFARTSRSHGERVPALDVLKALSTMTR